MAGALRSDNYINIQGWMVSELGLKGNNLLIYAIIYGMSQDGKGRYTGGLNYLASWTNSSKRGVMKNLTYLCENGYIAKEEKTINNIKFCEYYVPFDEENQGENQNIGCGTEFHSVEQSSPGYGTKFTRVVNKVHPIINIIIKYIIKIIILLLRQTKRWIFQMPVGMMWRRMQIQMYGIPGKMMLRK